MFGRSDITDTMYGSTEATDDRDLKDLPLSKAVVDDPDHMDWEDNGSVLGLCIDVVGSHASIAIALGLMVLGANTMELGTPCTFGEDGVDTLAEHYLCKYTQSYLEIFPYAAWAVFMLGAGKDLVQKRIYYGMLKVAGVIDFHSGAAYLDPIFLFVAVAYLHMLTYIGLIIHFAMKAGAMESEADAIVEGISLANHGGGRDARNALTPQVAAAVSLLLPATMTVVFLFLHYDISKGLVTLSQYVHDVTVSKSQSFAEETLKSLKVVEDRLVMDVVQRDAAGLLNKNGLDFIATCGVLRNTCLTEQAMPKDAPLVFLLSSLWPADVLMRTSIQDGGTAPAKSFRTVWYTFSGFAIVSISMTIVYMLFMVGKDMMTMSRHGEIDPALVLRDTAYLLALAVVSNILYVFVRALRAKDTAEHAKLV